MFLFDRHRFLKILKCFTAGVAKGLEGSSNLMVHKVLLSSIKMDVSNIFKIIQ